MNDTSERELLMKIKAVITILAVVTLISLLALSSPVDAAKRYAVVQEDTGRSFVPIRYVAETFGYDVKWTPETKTVKIQQASQYVELTEGSYKAISNGEQKKLDAAPLNIAGSLYVPLRFVAEQLGTDVKALDKNNIQLKNSKLETIIQSVSLNRFKQSIANPIATTSSKVATSNKSISINLVYIDLYSPSVDIDVYYANNKIGSVEPFKSMVANSKAKVAVNGTYFNAYSDTDEKVPYGYIIKNGETIHSAPGEKRAVFVYTTQSEAKVVSIDEFLKLKDNKQIKTAVQAGPLLVKNSKVVVDAAAEGFRDPKILTSRGARSVIGVTGDNKLVIGTTGAASIPELAEVMIKLGVVEAMNLDGGASSALFASGKYITPAGRELSNILTVQY